NLNNRQRDHGRPLKPQVLQPPLESACSTALVSDEYEPRDSVSSLTAFALNSGVYFVPFAMVPSSPIELEEGRNVDNGYAGLADRR
ncbi:hypothetical protein ABG881_10425, partial [Bifidobacterium longum]